MKPGDTLSPTIFSMLTVVLIRVVKLRFPQVRLFLFADKTLLFIPVNREQVECTLHPLLQLLWEYGEFLGIASIWVSVG